MAKQTRSTGLGTLGGGALDTPRVPYSVQNRTYVPPLSTISQATRNPDSIARFAQSMLQTARVMGQATSQWAAVDRSLGTDAGREIAPIIQAQIETNDPAWDIPVFNEKGEMYPVAEIQAAIDSRLGEYTEGYGGWYKESFMATAGSSALRAIMARGVGHRNEMIQGTLQRASESLLDYSTTWDPNGELPTPVEHAEVVIEQTGEVVRGLFPPRPDEPEWAYEQRVQGVWYSSVVRPSLQTMAKRGDLWAYQALDRQFNDERTQWNAGRLPGVHSEGRGLVDGEMVEVDEETGQALEIGGAPGTPLGRARKQWDDEHGDKWFADERTFWDWKAAQEDKTFALTAQQQTEAVEIMQAGMFEHMAASLDNPVVIEDIRQHVPQDDTVYPDGWGYRTGKTTELNRNWMTAQQQEIAGIPPAGADLYADKKAWIMPFIADATTQIYRNEQGFMQPIGQVGWADDWQPRLTSDIGYQSGGAPTTWNGMFVAARDKAELDKLLSAPIYNDPGSPVFLTHAQRSHLKRVFTQSSEAEIKDTEAHSAMMGGGNYITTAHHPNMIDVLKDMHDKTGLGPRATGVDHEGKIRNGLAVGYMLSNAKTVPSVLVETAMLQMMNGSISERMDVVAMAAIMGQMPDRAAYDDFRKAAESLPDGDKFEFAMTVIQTSTANLPLMDGLGEEMSVSVKNAVESLAVQLERIDKWEKPDTAQINRAAVHLGIHGEDDLIGATQNLVVPILAQMHKERGLLVRGESGVPMADDVTFHAMTNDITRGQIINLYADAVVNAAALGHPSGGASQSQFLEHVAAAFKQSVGQNFDLVVLDDHIDGSPQGYLVNVQDVSGPNRWWGQYNTDGTPRLTPWDHIGRFTKDNWEAFGMTSDNPWDPSMSALNITGIFPHPDGTGWFLVNENSQVIGWTPPPTPGETAMGVEPEEQIFVVELPALVERHQGQDWVKELEKARSHREEPGVHWWEAIPGSVIGGLSGLNPAFSGIKAGFQLGGIR